MAPGTHETKEDRQWQIDDSIANITEPEQMIGSQSEKRIVFAICSCLSIM